MNKHRTPRQTYSIRTIILMPMIVAIVIFMLVFIYKWQYDYNWLAENQGDQILSEINHNINDDVYEMLEHPLVMNQLLATQIQENHTYEDDNLMQIQEDIYIFYKTIYEEAPQVSAIRYGDWLGRFVGYRANEGFDGTELMLKDERTNDMFSIYKGSHLSDDLSRVTNNYDPRTRSWYESVKKTKSPQWTNVYMSSSLNTPMISSTYPILDETGQLVGVSDIGIQLNNIDDYLYNNRRNEKNVVYIVNDDWDLIASSDLEKNMIRAYDSHNTVIQKSALALEGHLHYREEMVRINVEGETYLALVSVLTEPLNIHWHIIVATPESELMGLVKERQNQTTLYMILLLVVLLAIAIYIMRLITEPITRLSKETKGIDLKGRESFELIHSQSFLSEINELQLTIEDMLISVSNAYKDMRLSEEKYRSLVENVEDFIFMMKPDMNLVTVNSAFEAFVNTEKEKILGRPMEEFVSDKEKIFWRAVISSVKATRETLRFRRRFILPEGTVKIIKMTLIPVFNDDQELTFILGSSSDITELVQAQNELTRVHLKEKENLELRVAERTQDLEKAMIEIAEKEKMASLAILVSGVAHEINTPLGVAVSANSYLESERKRLEMKLTEGSLSKTDFIHFLEAFEESGDMIKINLNRAAQLVKSFKEIAVKQSHDTLEVFNVKQYLEATITSLKHVNKHVNAEIKIECPDQLEIKSYPGALSQLVTNMIENSLKHAFKAKDNPEILIRISEREDTIELIYEDNGSGIPQAHIKKIFNPFFTTNRRDGGSGLGLNIVYNLVVNQLNGKITCESEVDQYTRFTVITPKIIKREGEGNEQQVE